MPPPLDPSLERAVQIQLLARTGSTTHREIITPRELLELVPKTTPIRVLRLLPIRYYGNFRILHPHPTVLRRHPFAAFGYFANTPFRHSHGYFA